MMRGRWRAAGALLVVAFVSVGTAGSGALAAAPAKVSVVAAEDFWASIARQLGGDHADVTSIIADPAIDPHDYEARPQDGAALATARVAIVNGVGYDEWADKLLAANPSANRKVVRVGDVVGVKDGGNPHQWYSPRSVDTVIDVVTDALKGADPADAAYFDAQRRAYRSDGLKRYNDLRAQITAEYAGTPVGASESVFAPLAADLGLKLLTPGSFLAAISDGTEPTARDKATVDQQLTGKQVKVFIYNSQNSTPDVAALVAKAKKAGIPVTTVTETLTPKGTTFQDWQARQLQILADALAEATGGSGGTTGDVAAAPSKALPRTGSRAGLPWLVGAAFVLGGFGVVIGSGVRRHRSSPGAA